MIDQFCYHNVFNQFEDMIILDSSGLNWIIIDSVVLLIRVVSVGSGHLQGNYLSLIHGWLFCSLRGREKQTTVDARQLWSVNSCLNVFSYLSILMTNVRGRKIQK